ncbi:M20 family metallopeptidase [Candidatus Sumerlaeota bacterium]|nr:M20 family metallopeptidase [Candidatus Sumerlaeota bacterium]
MANMNSLRKKLLSHIDSLKKEIIAASQYIHANPETGGEEYKSSKRLMDDLSSHGFQVTAPVGGMKTAFKARLKGKGKGPRIAFLAEYDALGSLGHACGHNFIGAASTFAGIAYESIIRELKGEILVIGTPGEENLGGKIILLKRGVFKDVDASLMTHPGNETRIEPKPLASQPLEFEFRGKPAHAAAAPWKGVNALDALIQLFISVDQMRKQQHYTVRTPGIITFGGERPNVVPERAVGQFSCRGADYEELKDVVFRIKRSAKAAALSTGTTVTWRNLGPGYKDLKACPVLAALFEKNWKSVGGILEPGMEEGKGSLDIGDISYEMPCLHPFIAIAPQNVGNHTMQFTECAIGKRAEKQLVLSVNALALTALDVLVNPGLLKQMKKDIEQ